ncbi:MAG: xanthine dehydrogenase family protein subunit M [Dehalococcoidales bacterium]
MMRLPKFERLLPSSVAEACQMLNQHKNEAEPIAGGSDILVSMKQRVITPKYLVDLTTIPNLDYLSYDDKKGLRMGPLTKIIKLARDAKVAEKYPAIAQAAASVGANQHQFMGTIGGNICLDTRCWYYNQSSFWRKSRAPCIKFNGDTCYIATASKVCVAVYSGDLAPSLIALGAEIKLSSPKGERVIPLSQLYSGDGKVYLTKEKDELVSEINLPPPPAKSCSAYMKLRMREAIDFPMMGVAVNVALSNGKCSQARVVLNTVASAPVLASDASSHLVGKELTTEVIQAAAEKAYREAKPISDTGGCPAVYRKKIVRVYTKRTLEQVVSKLT